MKRDQAIDWGNILAWELQGKIIYKKDNNYYWAEFFYDEESPDMAFNHGRAYLYVGIDSIILDAGKTEFPKSVNSPEEIGRYLDHLPKWDITKYYYCIFPNKQGSLPIKTSDNSELAGEERDNAMVKGIPFMNDIVMRNNHIDNDKSYNFKDDNERFALILEKLPELAKKAGYKHSSNIKIECHLDNGLLANITIKDKKLNGLTQMADEHFVLFALANFKENKLIDTRFLR